MCGLHPSSIHLRGFIPGPPLSWHVVVSSGDLWSSLSALWSQILTLLLGGWGQTFRFHFKAPKKFKLDDTWADRYLLQDRNLVPETFHLARTKTQYIGNIRRTLFLWGIAVQSVAHGSWSLENFLSFWLPRALGANKSKSSHFFKLDFVQHITLDQ